MNTTECSHEWVLISECLAEHPRFKHVYSLKQRVRRFYCKWCRTAVEDRDDEPVSRP